MPPESAPDDSLDADLVLAFVAWGHYEATVPLANEGTCAASTADEGPLAPHGGPPSHSNSAVAPGAPKAARRRRLPASFQSSFVILTLRGSIVKLGLALKVYLKFI